MTLAFTARQYNFKFKISGQLPESLDYMREGAMKLINPRTQAMLLKEIARETIMRPYRQKYLRQITGHKNFREEFLAKLPGMVNMRRERGKLDPRIEPSLVQKYLRASARVSDAKTKADARALITARRAQDAARESIRRSVKPKPASRRPFPSSGRFRTLALRVMELVADANEAHVVTGSGETMLGIGHLATLDKIKTPSATGHLTGRPTKSTRNILWRHLEFGTGAFATDKGEQLAKHRLPTGGWWYGRNVDMSLRLRGSKPGRVMGDPARRFASSVNIPRMEMSYNQVLSATLFGM